MKRLVAEVAIPRPIDRTFEYEIPDHYSDLPDGIRVRVPFGRSKVVGFLLRRKTSGSFEGRLQSILEPLDKETILTPEALALASWIRQAYSCPLGLVLQAILPQRLRPSKPSREKVVVLGLELAQTLQAIEQLAPSAPQQAKVLKALLTIETPTVKRLREAAQCSAAPINALQRRAIIHLGTQPLRPLPAEYFEDDKDFQLTGLQQQAVDSIAKAAASGGGGILLQGVNGSGKTEVYLRAVQQALSAGRTALVLVPEISLTPQLTARFRQRLGEWLALFHSGLTDAQQAQEWSRLRAGEARVALGVRSASLLPLPNLGLAVIDEEHESTYRQVSVEPRFHAREVLLKRCETENAVVVLGSATPSLEAVRMTQTRQLSLVTLPQRVVPGPAPRVELVDMSQARHWLSDELAEALGRVLAQGQQAMLFLNRRGFGVAHCRKCRRTLRCPSCDISLVFHVGGAQLCCHYCNYTLNHPRCQRCRGEVDFFGLGTQRVESLIKKRFPTARLARMDSDSVARGQHGPLLEKFRSGAIDILLGTQMISVGHDFPNVEFMGILDADTLLDVPDFRSAERTFQLLSQAAGRAGRGQREGLVVLQTRHPDHYAIQCAIERDFWAFAKQEMALREALNYPPYSKLITVQVSSPGAEQAQHAVANLVDSLGNLPTLDVLGPSRALPYQWKGQFRWQLLAKTHDAVDTLAHIREAIAELSIKRVRIEVDP